MQCFVWQLGAKVTHKLCRCRRCRVHCPLLKFGHVHPLWEFLHYKLVQYREIKRQAHRPTATLEAQCTTRSFHQLHSASHNRASINVWHVTSSSPEIQYVECGVFPRSRKGDSKENVHAMHWPSHLHKLLEFVDSTASSSRLEAVAIELMYMLKNWMVYLVYA